MKLHFFSAAFIEYLVGFGPYSLGALLHFFFYHNFVYVWSNSCFFFYRIAKSIRVSEWSSIECEYEAAVLFGSIRFVSSLIALFVITA